MSFVQTIDYQFNIVLLTILFFDRFQVSLNRKFRTLVIFIIAAQPRYMPCPVEGCWKFFVNQRGLSYHLNGIEHLCGVDGKILNSDDE